MITEKIFDINGVQIRDNQLKTKKGDIIHYWMNLKDLYPAKFYEYQKVNRNITNINAKS